MTKTQNIFEQHLRLAASYTSKEAADHEEPEIDLARIPSDDHHRWWRSPCCAGDQLSIICFVWFFKISHNRSDSGLLKGSESFVKKRWRRTRLGQCLWCTRSKFLRSRTHWSQGAWKKLSSRPSCQIFQQWLPASIGKRHDSHHHHHNHHHHHHSSSGMWYLGLHNHIF